MANAPTREQLTRRDDTDPLAGFRDAFDLPAGIIYLDGNSLGPLPSATPARLAQLVEQEWGRDLIKSWNDHDWIDYPQRLGAKIARLVGAHGHEVVAADSTSVNLFKLLSAGFTMRPDRNIIVSEIGNFPTDLYIAQGLTAQNDDRRLRMVEKRDVLAAIDGDTAIVSLTHVDYRTGEMHDMAAVTAAVQEKGALMLWDLSHSAGAVSVDLNACNVDLAVGCGYKYLNGGPGAPAYLFVADRHQAVFEQPLSGWMGHAAPFDFRPDYRPAEGIARYLCGTPGIIAMAALEVGIDLSCQADMTRIRAKSVALCETFIALVEESCGEYGFELVSPRTASIRGSQVSFAHENGYPIMQALIDRGVIGDFRAPNILRFGLTPLYLRHTDVWDAVAVLREVMESGSWDAPKYHARSAVT